MIKVTPENIGDLTEVKDDKREQLVTKRKPIQKTPAKKVGRPRKLEANTSYRYAKVLLPTKLKKEFDYLFIEHDDLREL